MSFLRVGSSLLSLAGRLVRTDASGIPVQPEIPLPGADLPTASLAGIWDASILPVGARYSIPDTSSAGRNAAVDATNAPKIVARTFGTLSGFYDEGNASNYTVRQPVITDYAVKVAAVPVGAGQTLTVALAWTRPNQRQPNGGAFSNAAITLLKVAGTSVVSLGGSGSDALTLFPDSAAPVSVSTLSMRHTQWLKVVFRGTTVDLYLGGTKVIAAAPNQITLGATADLDFLRAAHCVFHKAAAWSKAHDSTEDATVASNMATWAFGARPASYSVLIGQSNAGLLSSNYGLLPRLCKILTWMTGNPASNVLCGGYNISGATLFSGQGLYDNTAGLILDKTGGGDPSTWPLGANGNGLMSALTAMTADERANTYGIFWYWSEADSAMLVAANKAEYSGALKRAFSLIRANLGRTAATLPIMVINALPFITADGCQTHRQAMQDLINDPTQNVRFVLANALDAIGQGDGWDSATGLESGAGNSSHRDLAGALAYSRRMVYPMARSLLAAQVASGKPDAVTALDASLPLVGGPKITTAKTESSTSVLITFAHDGGSDIVVPLRAGQGVGWSLNGTIKATACVRVSTTQVRLTFPNAPVGALLYYGYGSGLDANNAFAEIGRGNAVTDNFSAAVLASGLQVSAFFGAAEQTDNPVQVTNYGVALT